MFCYRIAICENVNLVLRLVRNFGQGFQNTLKMLAYFVT